MPYSDLMPGEPVIMPYQSKPFNNDKFIAEEFLRLKEKFDIKTVIECGSAVGGTTKWLGENFEIITTIEINETFNDFCLKRTGSPYNVVSLLGNTLDVLPDVLQCYSYHRETLIIFIDSHWGEFCPLERELEIIAASGLQPCLAIHDFLVPGKPEFGYDSYNGQPFTFEWLKPHFDKIYGLGGYEHYYNTGFHEQSAQRGILYVTPKNQ